MCAKLRTVAASNNRVHPTRSLHYCLFAPTVGGVVLRADPVRAESHIQRNANREVARVAIGGKVRFHHTTVYDETNGAVRLRLPPDGTTNYGIIDAKPEPQHN